MNSSEEQLETLAQKIEQREQHARRRAWLVTSIPIIFAGLFLAYTIWQISIKTTQLSVVETKMNAISAQRQKRKPLWGQCKLWRINFSPIFPRPKRICPNPRLTCPDASGPLQVPVRAGNDNGSTFPGADGFGCGASLRPKRLSD